MRYWDSSALLPLLVSEATSSGLLALIRQDPAIVTWWGSAVECVSALARLEREGGLDGTSIRIALARLDGIQREWTEVPAVSDVRATAIRLLRVHRLRAADALQLAAAVVAADFNAATLAFVTLDVRLADAADREGFAVLGAR